MNFRFSLLLYCLLPSVIFVSACAEGDALRSRASSIIVDLNRAQNPAYRCEEAALADARAHLRFLEMELKQGNYFRARDHLDSAEPRARIAIKAADRRECQDDTDKDGIADILDRCPTEPEDKDGYQDEDGCPEDQDTDKDGINDSRDACPTQPEDFDGIDDEDGCPEQDLDQDGDGILDRVDQCPKRPEDKDGFQDTDGCPDLDNDQDRIMDVDDQCPLEPEDYDNDEDTDGCPDIYKRIVIKDDRIELKQMIYFATNKDRILSKSYPLLNEVAQALVDFSKINVSIEGHTDSRGNDRYNLDLSKRRAASVRRYLIAQGVDGSRMKSQGFGETKPIDDNRTKAGRAANRRVEFLITKK
jgi:outer membrane protein OmpA-like peptidoglycan-associated protein